MNKRAKNFLKSDLFLISILFVIVLILYLPSMNGRLFFDDEYFVIRNSYVQNFNIIDIFLTQSYAGAGQAGSFYRPLELVSYSVIYQVFSINPIPYHLLSVLLHFGAGVFLFFLIRDFKISRLIAFFSSLLFLIHPVNTQAVSYVSGLGEPLGLFFLLLGFLIYRKKEYFENKYWSYILFFVCMIFSLLSKERSIVFLLLFIVMEISFSSKKINFKNVFSKEKFIIFISVIIMFFYFLILKFGIGALSSKFSFFGEGYDSIIVRMITFFHSIFEYFVLIFFPINLYSEKPFEIITSFFNLQVILGLVIVLIVLIFSFYKTRSRYREVIFFSGFWFFISLAPSSGILQLSYTFKEHWIYYSMVGFCFGFTYLFFKIIKNKKLAISIFVIICLILCPITFVRNSDWANPKAFFENELFHNPNSENAIANLAYEYYLDGNIDDALELYSRGVNLTTTKQLAMMNYNLGYMYYLKGDVEKAIPFYKKSLEFDPNYLYALAELSKYYYANNDTDNFNDVYSRYIRIQRGMSN